MAIYTSAGLVITPAYTYEPHHPLVGWRNYVTFAGLTADSSQASYPVTNLANPSTHRGWRSDSLLEQLVTVANIDAAVDYVAIARHNFGTGGIEVSVEAITADPGAVWTEVFAGVLLADDTPAIFRFASGNYVSVRLRLVPTATKPQCAVLYVGSLTALKPGVAPGYVPLPRAKNHTAYNGQSEAGEYLGTIISGASLASTAQIADMDPDFYADEVADFIARANERQPFFFAWSPEDYPTEVAYAWLSASVQPTIARSTGNINLNLPMAGLTL